MKRTSARLASSTRRRNSTKKQYTIFHIDSERGFRGGERQLIYLAGYLRAEGHDNVIVCRKGGALAKEALRVEFKVMHLPFWGEWDLVSAIRLRIAAARSRHPAIFHAHTAHGAALAYLASRLGGPATVAHRRVDFNVSNGLSARLKYGSGITVAVSKSIEDILAGNGLPEAKLKVVHDCVPTTEAEANQCGLSAPIAPASESWRRKLREQISEKWKVPAGDTWIGNMAALVPHKDQETLLRSIAEVRRNVGHVQLFIIGTGPLESELKRLAESLGISEFVHFVGYQTNGIHWLQALDLFVLSSWGEGMGSVLLEAMACRVPIVATTAGGIPEVVQNRGSGILVPPRSPDQLAAAMIEMLKDPRERAKMVENGVRRLDEFSVTHSGRRMEEIYDGLYLNGHK